MKCRSSLSGEQLRAVDTDARLRQIARLLARLAAYRGKAECSADIPNHQPLSKSRAHVACTRSALKRPKAAMFSLKAHPENGSMDDGER